MLCVFLLLSAIPRQQSRTPFDVVRWSALFRGTQREYSSKPLKRSTVKRILVFKR